MAKIRVRGAVKRFGQGPDALLVLDRVDLDLQEHSFVVMVGPSGCGKTTLLNALAGFTPLDEGTIEIDGAPVRSPSRRRVYVSQEPSCFPWFTVEENIAFPLLHEPPEVRQQRVEQQLQQVELGAFRHAYPAQLSGGMKQRLEFGRALVVDPEVLFLDEPFGALDPFVRMEYCRELARLWKETGKTCVMVTHDLSEACALATHIVVLSTRPARVVELIENPLPRPRNLLSDEFEHLKWRLHELLKLKPLV